MFVLMRLRGGSAYGQVDCCVHGSAPRKTLSGQRRFVLYRYGPSWANSRYGYPPSVELLRRLTPERRKIMYVCAACIVRMCGVIYYSPMQYNDMSNLLLHSGALQSQLRLAMLHDGVPYHGGCFALGFCRLLPVRVQTTDCAAAATW